MKRKRGGITTQPASLGKRSVWRAFSATLPSISRFLQAFPIPGMRESQTDVIREDFCAHFTQWRTVKW
jgi:hypothetical protein